MCIHIYIYIGITIRARGFFYAHLGTTKKRGPCFYYPSFVTQGGAQEARSPAVDNRRVGGLGFRVMGT